MGDRLILKITLLEVTPPVWRRVQIPADVSFARLNLAIQAVFGWGDGDAHQFSIGGLGLASPDDTSGADTENERKYRLRDLVPKKHKVFYYGYRFDQGWTMQIDFESVTSGEERPGLVCLGGERAAPPEECGGPECYAAFLRGEPALKTPVPRGFDPEVFDLAQANERLAEIDLAHL